MFEKEAKEYRNHNTNYYEWDDFCADDGEAIETAYQKGAIDGYNKANEWQYVSEKGAPKKTGNYHLWLGKCNYAVTYYDGIKFWEVSEDPEAGWIDINDVIAWKEFILPKGDEINGKRKMDISSK